MPTHNILLRSMPTHFKFGLQKHDILLQTCTVLCTLQQVKGILASNSLLVATLLRYPDSTVCSRRERILSPRSTIEALFTSRVFEGMGGDYPVSRNFPGRLFTRLGFERIIPEYPYKSPTQ
jgi:hypothetical protein